MESYLRVNLDYIDKNINNLKALNPDKLFCAVVKANAYGMGLVTVAKSIEDIVDYFAVARLDEALALRKNHIKKPIMLLGYTPYDSVDKCIKYDIDIPVYDLSYAKKINDSIDKKLNVHIAVDTGHGRLGFRENEIDNILEIKKFNNLNVIGIFSHYSTADEDDPSFTKIQNEKFEKILSEVKTNFDFKYIHIANSAGAIKYASKCNLVRVGLSIYGIYPSLTLKDNNILYLYQSFKFISRISFVKEIDEGTPISYGRTFISDRKMKVATIPIGYADGFSRAFSNKGEVLINDKLCKILGRVCMDQLMVDVTNLEVSIDDEVLIYPDIYKEAKKIDTISYELMTSVGLRVPRVYIKNGKIINKDNYLGEIYEN